MAEHCQGVHERRVKVSDASSLGPSSSSKYEEDYDKRHPQTVDHRVLDGHVETQNSHETTETDFASSIGNLREVPPAFQFYVRSEEGINLTVDLNSSPSDWNKILKNEVCIYRNVHNSKPLVLQQELRNLGDSDRRKKTSFLWNTESGFQSKGYSVCAGVSLSSIVREKDGLGVDNSVGTDVPLRSSIIPCKLSGHLEKNRLFSDFSRPNFEEQSLVVASTGSSTRDEETMIVNSEVANAPQKKSTCNFVVDSKEFGEKCLNSLDRQNLKLGSICPGNFERRLGTCSNSQEIGLSLSGETFEDSIIHNTGTLENPSEVYPGCLTSGNMEMPLSEVAGHQKNLLVSPQNNCPLGLVDLVHNMQTENVGSMNCKLDQNTISDPSSCPEEWEKSNLMNERESSECSEIENLSERTSKRSCNSEFPEKFQNKRQNSKSGDHNGCTKPAAKNKKRTKRLAGNVLPRRSMRLVSK